MVRALSVWLSLASLAPLLLVTSADAILRRYDLRQSNFTQQSNVSPNPEFRSGQGIGVAVFDNDGESGSPVLKRFVVDLGGIARIPALPSTRRR